MATRALIIGGGITGLTTALALHRAGLEVAVFERAEEIAALGVGINLLPHSVKELWSLGLREALEATAIHTSALRYHSKHGKMIWSEPRGMAAGYDWPQYSIHRGELQMVLLAAVTEQLGAAALHTGREFVAAAEQDGNVTARFSDGSEASGDVLIGADGLMSAVRAQFYPDEGNPVYSGQVLWRGVVEWEPVFDGRTVVMAGHDQLKAVLYPISEPHRKRGRTLLNWIAERRIDRELPDNKGDWNRIGDKSDFRDHFADWQFDWLDFPTLFDAAEGVWEFPMVDRDPLERWSFSRVTLAGDAAHAMRPNGSNGASQGVLDAISLARQLGSCRADRIAAALTAYQDERLEPTAKLTLANRATGPEVVLQMVEERCPDGFDDIHQHFSREELAEIAESYKKLAGFSLKELKAGSR